MSAKAKGGLRQTYAEGWGDGYRTRGEVGRVLVREWWEVRDEDGVMLTGYDTSREAHEWAEGDDSLRIVHVRRYRLVRP